MSFSFSIVMPTYNRKHCIKNAINSLLSQAYQNFELIIIDDGSTDGTGDFLKENYKNEIKTEKIKYVELGENKGVSYARNEGLELAKNEWIGYLDSDNQMHVDFLETFVNAIKKNTENNLFYAQLKKVNSGDIIGHNFDFEELIVGNFIDLGVFVHSAKVYKELGGFDVRLTRLVDWDLIIRYASKYKPFFVEKVLLDYYDGAGFARITNSDPHNDNYKEVILNYYKNISADKFIDEYITVNRKAKIADQRSKEINVLNLTIQQKNQEIEQKNQEIEQKNQEIEQKNQEILFMRSSKFWKLRERYLKFKTKLEIK